MSGGQSFTKFSVNGKRIFLSPASEHLTAFILLAAYQFQWTSNNSIFQATISLVQIQTFVELFKFSSFTLQLYIMNFLNLPELIQAVSQHEQFQHEIKGKRIKKELSNLEEYHNEQISFQRYFISSAGLSFFLEIRYQHRFYNFEVLVNFQYPFDRPKIFYLHDTSQYAFCQDLLDTLLEGNIWGPSMLLSSIFDKIHFLAKYIHEESQVIKAVYQLGDIYMQDLLTRHKIELFNVEEYEWKYMIKSTFKRVLGLSKETLLKFLLDGNNLKLDSWIKIKDLKEANASISQGKFKLDILCNSETLKKKLYFGGEEADAQKILYFMNPIQVTERKLSKPEKESYKEEQVQEMVHQYSDLIEFYSLRDPQKTKKYVALMQELIKKNYDKSALSEPKMEELKDDIKT